MDMRFGDPKNPLLLSIRSGARASMPGMMDTVLNLGLNSSTVTALAELTGNEWFAWDCYRRFVAMYGDVVLGLKPESKEEEDPFEVLIDKKKKALGIKLDIEFTKEDLKDLVASFKQAIKEKLNVEFPEDPIEQLWGAIGAVFQSWMNARAIAYRKLNNIPASWGTAVNVQSMVFGNIGLDSGTGVAFTRNPSTGENVFYGEYLLNAQGEDVVAGTRTPLPINKKQKTDPSTPCLEEEMPEAYKQTHRNQGHPGTPFQEHAGRGVHHPAQKALDAPDPKRQKDCFRRVQGCRGHGEGGAHRQGRGAYAGES